MPGAEAIIAYQKLRGVHDTSRVEVKSQPIDQQDGTIDAYGALIKSGALNSADSITRAANYNRYGPGPHYVEIGSGYWYIIGEQRLVQRTWRRNRLGLYRPDFANAPDATARDWYIHGLQVADGLISSFTGAHQLPRSLGRVLNPK